MHYFAEGPLLTRADLESRVDLGIARLRVQDPAWFRKINLEYLNIANPMCCVVGQWAGGFTTGLKKLGIPLDRRALPTAYGFALDGIIYHQSDWNLLNQIWREKIRALLDAKSTEPEEEEQLPETDQIRELVPV